MLHAISKFLPRAFQKKSRSKSSKSSLHSDVSLESTKQFTCRVLLLDESELALDIKLTSKGYVFLDRVFAHLNITEREYFGLRYLDEFKQPLWLDINKSIVTQLQGESPHSLYFGVKFYAVDPCKLTDESTRYQFFLQVKQDILQGRLPIPLEVAAHLAAYAVQSELGDFDPTRHPPDYVSKFAFVPNQTQEFEFKVTFLHQTIRGQVPSRAEYHYLDKVKWMDMYGVDIHPVIGDGNIEYFLGLTPSGIVVYKNKTKVTNYFWPRVSKVTYKNKFFVIRARDKNNVENTYSFECSSKQACKHLYKCCVDYHSFFRFTSASQSFQQSMGRLLSFGSKYRYSGRSSKSSSSMDRSDEVVIRRSTSHQFKRTSGSASCPEDSTSMPRPISSIVLSEPVNKCHRRDGYSSGPETSRITGPWEARNHDRRPYTGRESPTSVHSEYFPRHCVSGNESDRTICPRRHRHAIYPSDTETDGECRHHRRQRANAGSASDSDVSSCRRGHRHRHRGRSIQSVKGLEPQNRMRNGQLTAGSFDLHSNGSLSSMVSAPDQRRHRKRSKSPGNNRPPDELAQHFRYVDPTEEGMSEDQLKDIPYTRVETAAGTVVKLRYSPRTRHRIRQYRRQKSCGELPNNSFLRVPDGEAPPPYLDPNMSYQRSLSMLNNNMQLVTPLTLVPPLPTLHRHPHHHQCYEFEFLKSPMAIQVTETQTAPIVKTRVFTRNDEPPYSASNAFGDRSNVTTTRHVFQTQTCLNQQQSNLFNHVREDSGLDLDSPGGSSNSHMVEQQQHQQQLQSPSASYNQTHRSPIADTSAQAPRTSLLFTEQASSEENHVSSTSNIPYLGHPGQGHNDLERSYIQTTVAGRYSPGVSYYCDFGGSGGTTRRRPITDL